MLRKEELAMESYDDYMDPDMLLLDEIRETVTTPPMTFVFPTAARIGRPMQRTVKAGGS